MVVKGLLLHRKLLGLCPWALRIVGGLKPGGCSSGLGFRGDLGSLPQVSPGSSPSCTGILAVKRVLQAAQMRRACPRQVAGIKEERETLDALPVQNLQG